MVVQAGLILGLALALPTVASAQYSAVQTGACAPQSTRSGVGENMRPWNDSVAHSRRPARVVGQVVDVLDRPIVRSIVILQRGLSPAERVATAIPDSLGLFVLDSITPAEYVLNVRGIGYQQQWHALRLVGAAVDTICVRMRAMPVGLAPVGD